MLKAGQRDQHIDKGTFKLIGPGGSFYSNIENRVLWARFFT